MIAWGCQVPIHSSRPPIGNSSRGNHRQNRATFIASAKCPTCIVVPAQARLFLHRLPDVVCLRSFATSAVGGRGTQGKSWNTITLWQSGLNRPQPVEISHEERTIRGSAPVMKALQVALRATIPEVWTTLDDRGNPQIHWPAGTDSAVQKYLDLHKGNAESPYLYEGAFATGVKRAKVLSLAVLALSTAGGPMIMMAGSAGLLQTFLGAAVMVGGVLISAATHVVTTPYVLSLRRLADGSFQAETALATGAVKYTHFTRQEVMPSNKPFCTFSAKGHYFYVHKELFVGDDAQAMLCELLGDEAAENMYEEQLKKNPGDLDALYNYGRFLWKVRGDLEAAEVAFTKILAEDPSDKEALKVLKAVQVLRQPAAGGAGGGGGEAASKPATGEGQ